jgi:hypothetical protein
LPVFLGELQKTKLTKAHQALLPVLRTVSLWGLTLPHPETQLALRHHSDANKSRTHQCQCAGFWSYERCIEVAIPTYIGETAGRARIVARRSFEIQLNGNASYTRVRTVGILRANQITRQIVLAGRAGRAC